MRRIIQGFLIAQVGVLIWAALALAVGTEEPRVVTFILGNGLKVVVVPARTQQTVLVLRVGAGFLDERPDGDPTRDETGVAHELEHAMFRGTKALPSKELLIAAFNAMGARYNASTNFERTNYFLVVPSRALAQATKLQSDMIAESLLTDSSLDSEARPVSEELMRNRANVYSVLYQYALIMHGEHERMRQPMASTPEQTLAERPAAIRAFYERYYSADNMQLAIVGQVTDPIALKELLEKTYGRIRRFPVAVPQLIGGQATDLAGGQLPLAFNGRLPMHKVYTPGEGTHVVNIGFNLENSVDKLPAATLLGAYLSRRGAGSVFEALRTTGLLRGVYMSSEHYRDRMMLRLILDLTPEGEKRIAAVLAYVSSVLGGLARNGLSDRIVEELRAVHVRTKIERTGLIDLGEHITDAVARHGLERAEASLAATSRVKKEDIQNLAAELMPYRMQLTSVTHDVPADAPVIYGNRVQTVNLSEILPQLAQAYVSGEGRLDNSSNPLLAVDSNRRIRTRGVDVTVVPQAGGQTAEGRLYFALPHIRLSPEQSMAARLALLAFELDPTNAALMRMATEAGISLSQSLDLEQELFSISVSGRAHGATLALTLFLQALKNYRVTERGLQLAKVEYVQRARAMTGADVTRQALGMGHQYLNTTGIAPLPGRINVDASAVVARSAALAQAVTLQQATQIFDAGRRRWALTGIFTGGWSPTDLQTALAIASPRSPRRPVRRVHNGRFPLRDVPQLVVREGAYERQSIARFYPVDVQEFSDQYWAFQIFARILNERLDRGVRTERGYAYAVGARFTALENGGSALVITADTSRSAMELAMAYSEVMNSLLAGGITSEEMNWAKSQQAASVTAMARSVDGLYAGIYQGLNVQRAALFLRSLDADKTMKLVREALLARATEAGDLRHMDAAIVGSADSATTCREALTPR